MKQTSLALSFPLVLNNHTICLLVPFYLVYYLLVITIVNYLETCCFVAEQPC